jgi:hypothetical protein
MYISNSLTEKTTPHYATIRTSFYVCMILSILCVGILIADDMNRVVHHDFVNGITPIVNTPIALGDSTIVTAYFEFPSKHTSGEFTSWMQNMLSLQDPMVIFTTKDKEEMFYRMRGHALNRTLVIVMQLADAEVVRLYGTDFWTAQHNIDPANTVNVNPLLYVVWNEKMKFVQKSITLNPFNSSYFMWMDVGFLRHGRYNGKRIAVDSTPFAGDRVLMLDITAMTHNVLHPFTKNENRIGAGMFGGSNTAMARYHDQYYQTLSSDIIEQRFVGVEQVVMWRTCEREPDLCHITPIRPTCGESWRFCFRFKNRLHQIVDWSFVPNDSEVESPWFHLVPFLVDRLWVNNHPVQ